MINIRGFIKTKISGKRPSAGRSIEITDGTKRKNLEKARRGENIARKYLRDRGYRIIDQNYRTRYAEIDLVAEDKGTLVFVEVRTRGHERFGTPEETINKNKIRKLIRNARGYLSCKAYNKPYRIDAVCIVLGEYKEPERISHYKNITYYFMEN